jgi:cytochrome c-type biogenesis protein CcmH/NrfF
MGKIIFWIVLLVGAGLILTALIVWLAPLLASLVILWLTLKAIQRSESNPQIHPQKSANTPLDLNKH